MCVCGGGGFGGQRAAGEMEEREMHQPGICPGFYFHAPGCSSAPTCDAGLLHVIFYVHTVYLH